MTFQEFAAKYNVTMNAVPAGEHVIDGKTPFKWSVTLKYNSKEYQVDYTLGSAHVVWRSTGKMVGYANLMKEVRAIQYGERFLNPLQPKKPDIENVLYSLVMDIGTIVTGSSLSWEEFADEFGWNVDSIKDREVYFACLKEYDGLRKLFGREILKELCECTEE